MGFYGESAQSFTVECLAVFFFIPICSVEEYNVSVLKCELKNDAQTKLSDSIVVSIQSSDDLYNKNKAKTDCNKIRFKTTLCI